MSLPRAPAILPDDFAAALGHAVAAFGFLEEALKRAIYALSRDHLGETPGEAELDAWVMRMEQIADDSLGTLIDAFVSACDRCDAEAAAGARALAADLRSVRDRRNMLCHASWRPAEGGDWRPGFVSSRGIPAPERMSAADLGVIRADALAAARRVVVIARQTGNDSWSPDAEAGPRELERARAAKASGDAARASDAGPPAKRGRRGAPASAPEE